MCLKKPDERPFLFVKKTIKFVFQTEGPQETLEIKVLNPMITFRINFP